MRRNKIVLCESFCEFGYREFPGMFCDESGGWKRFRPLFLRNGNMEKICQRNRQISGLQEAVGFWIVLEVYCAQGDFQGLAVQIEGGA